MAEYTDVVEGFVNEFVSDSEEVRKVVVEAAELYREDYYRIVGVDEDNFDEGELRDLFNKVEEEIRFRLKAHELI